jgi:hypothetical protein
MQILSRVGEEICSLKNFLPSLPYYNPTTMGEFIADSDDSGEQNSPLDIAPSPASPSHHLDKGQAKDRIKEILSKPEMTAVQSEFSRLPLLGTGR